MKKNILKLIKENNEAGLLANIHQQTDVKFVDEAASIIGELRKIFEENKLIKDTENLIIDSKEGNALVRRLENVLTSRFIVDSKASFKILANLGENAFANVITPNTARSMLLEKTSSTERDLSEIIDYLERYYGASRELASDQELDFNSLDGYKAILERNIKSAKELEKKLEASKVEFDLKNATIKGLPDDMYFMVSFDFVFFIKNFNDREVASVLLHEVGHVYIVLLDLYRTADTNVMLYDIISMSNGSNPEKIAITMAKEFGVDAPNLSGKKKEREFVFFVSSIMESLARGKNTNLKNTTAAERLADVFPVRMGLGVEYFNVNKKVNFSTAGYSEIDYRLDIPTRAVISNSLLIAGVVILALELATPALIIFGPIYLIFAGIIKTMMIVDRFFIGTDDANSTIYDDSKRRLESIRNDFVRRINSTIGKDKLDRELIKERILELEVMDNDISKFRKNRSLIGMAGEFIIPSLRRKSKETMINELLENMEANKLQVLSEKIKLSGGL